MSHLIVGLYEDRLWLDERIETLSREIEETRQARPRFLEAEINELHVEALEQRHKSSSPAGH